VKSTLLLLAALLLGAGCAKNRTRPVAPTPPKAAPAIEPVITPAGPEPGRITQVNEKHRYVVVDFGRNTPPPAGSRLSARRHAQPVAVLRLTESGRGRFRVADVLEGDPRVGDEVLPLKGDDKP
jgi:hypothetical protein